MTSQWVADYLGDFAADTTDEQKELIAQAGERISQLIPGEDMATERMDALSAAVQIILGDDILTRFGAAEQLARTRLNAAMTRSQGAIIAADLMGTPIATIADQAQVGRPTVYKRLGRA